MARIVPGPGVARSAEARAPRRWHCPAARPGRLAYQAFVSIIPLFPAAPANAMASSPGMGIPSGGRGSVRAAHPLDPLVLGSSPGPVDDAEAGGEILRFQGSTEPPRPVEP
jgi:hypothetical protein